MKISNKIFINLPFVRSFGRFCYFSLIQHININHYCVQHLLRVWIISSLLRIIMQEHLINSTRNSITLQYNKMQIVFMLYDTLHFNVMFFFSTSIYIVRACQEMGSLLILREKRRQGQSNKLLWKLNLRLFKAILQFYLNFFYDSTTSCSLYHIHATSHRHFFLRCTSRLNVALYLPHDWIQERIYISSLI